MSIVQKSLLLAGAMLLLALALNVLPHSIPDRWAQVLPMALLVFTPWAIRRGAPPANRCNGADT